MVSEIASFIALSVGGILNAGFLVWKHQQKKTAPLVCPLNHDCSKVTESKWSAIFYFRNDTLGLLFFIGMLSMIMAAWFLPEQASLLHLLIIIGAGGAVLFSLFLLGVQKFILKDYCFYCLISAVITILLLVNGVFL